MNVVKLCCSSCRKEVMLEEEVTLDIINTITHINCHQTTFLLKDTGTFQEMITKYPFLID